MEKKANRMDKSTFIENVIYKSTLRNYIDRDMQEELESLDIFSYDDYKRSIRKYLYDNHNSLVEDIKFNDTIKRELRMHTAQYLNTIMI